MGRKIIITEYTRCSSDDPPDDHKNIVHACGHAGGDSATLCGLPFVDEVKTMEDTRKPVNCRQCVMELEHQERYVKRNGKWY